MARINLVMRMEICFLFPFDLWVMWVRVCVSRCVSIYVGVFTWPRSTVVGMWHSILSNRKEFNIWIRRALRQAAGTSKHRQAHLRFFWATGLSKEIKKVNPLHFWFLPMSLALYLFQCVLALQIYVNRPFRRQPRYVYDGRREAISGHIFITFSFFISVIVVCWLLNGGHDMRARPMMQKSRR